MSANKNANKPDVGHPDKSAPPTTSKPVIVTNRPILKDPMMIDENSDADSDGKGKLAHTDAPTLQPPEASSESGAEKSKPEPPKESPQTEPEASSEPEPETPKQDDNDNDQEAVKQTQHSVAIQELIDSRKYELPINAVEKRKTKHFVVLGVVLAVFLALVWVDIALDADLIHISGIKPVTHLFSN
jgi:hypothetical protein